MNYFMLSNYICCCFSDKYFVTAIKKCTEITKIKSHRKKKLSSKLYSK